MKANSPYESLLESNCAPSEQESTLIKEYLANQEEEFAQLERALRKDGTTSDLASQPLFEQLKNLRERIEAHRALLAPMRRVPDEILREIFVQCLPATHNATISAGDAPLLLRHVCLRWRHVAITTPRLWSTIHIPLPSSSPSQVSLAEGWIGHTGAVPLSVSFSSVKDPSESTLSYLASWCQRLAPIQDRLRAVELTLQADTEEDVVAFIEEQRQSGRDLLSQVAKAAIHISIGDSSFITDSIPIFHSLALHANERLRELEFTCNFHIFTFPDTSVDSLLWTNLKVLDLQSRNVSRSSKRIVRNGVLLGILSCCPNLEVLKAFAAGTIALPRAQGYPASPPNVVNSKLQHVSLALLNLSELSTVDLIAQSNWPSLKSFHLGSLSDNDGQEERSYVLERLMMKYGQALTSFRVSYHSIPPRHLIELLALLPNVVQLHVDNGATRGWCGALGGDDENHSECDSDDDGLNPEGGDGVLESLTPKQDGGLQHSCPFLQYLRWEGHTPFSDAAVKNLLTSRSSPSISPVRIKQLVIKFDRSMQEDVRAACTHLINDGLKLRLSYYANHNNKNRVPNAYRDLCIYEDPLALGWE